MNNRWTRILTGGLIAAAVTALPACSEWQGLNTLDLLPRLAAAGVVALKIEGRQRGAAYVSAVTRVWRAAIDRLRDAPEGWQPQPAWQQVLAGHAEGHQTTLGPYHRGWQ